MEKNNNNNVLLLDIRRSLENIKNELGSHVIFIRSLFLPRRGNQYLMYIYSVMPCMYYFALCSSIWQQWRPTLGHWSMFFFFFLPCRCTITQKRITVIHIDLHVPHTSAMRGWARGLNVKNVFCLAEKERKCVGAVEHHAVDSDPSGKRVRTVP